MQLGLRVEDAFDVSEDDGVSELEEEQHMLKSVRRDEHLRGMPG